VDYQRPLHLEELWPEQPAPPAVSEVAQAFRQRLERIRREEIVRGVTVIGPHRDDMHFLVDGVDMTLYGSRGQQRSTALALKLAEMDLMTQATGETPVLLLDDVMSELDARRRGHVMDAMQGVQQFIITTTDWNDFTPQFLARAHRLQVVAGCITPFEAG